MSAIQTASEMAEAAAIAEAVAEAPVELPWPRVIQLQHPIDYNNERITSIEVRRGNLGIMKGIKVGNEVQLNDLLLVASRLTGKPVALIEKLDCDDGEAVMEYALDFFSKSTGGRHRRR